MWLDALNAMAVVDLSDPSEFEECRLLQPIEDQRPYGWGPVGGWRESGRHRQVELIDCW